MCLLQRRMLEMTRNNQCGVDIIEECQRENSRESILSVSSAFHFFSIFAKYANVQKQKFLFSAFIH